MIPTETLSTQCDFCLDYIDIIFKRLSGQCSHHSLQPIELRHREANVLTFDNDNDANCEVYEDRIVVT